MELPPTVSRVFTKSKRLRQLKDQTDLLRKLDGRLKRHVKTPLSEHTTLATVSDGCLVVHVDGPTWAARLRYKIPETLAALAGDDQFEPIRSIRIRSLSQGRVLAPTRAQRYLGTSPACHLEAATETIENIGIRRALLRLAAQLHIYSYNQFQ